jgi:hypothetical protein
VLVPLAQATTLTGVSVFGGIDAGGRLGSGGWNTVCNVSPLSLSLSGSALATCPLSLDISALGTYTFQWSGSSNLGDQYANLELFFNGAQDPGLHVLIDRNAPSPTLQVPPGNECLVYYCGNVSGPSTFIYSDGTNPVTVNSFTATGVGGGWSGTFSFTVGSAVPEPGTLGFGALALLLIPLLRPRGTSRG